MTIVGITGGIGSGKSTVSKILSVMGYPVFDSDQAGKLAYQNEKIKQEVISLLGNSVVDEENNIIFKGIADLVFSDRLLLFSLNKIIHPFVQNSFETWLKNQTTKLVFKESAILIESGASKNCDFIVTVVADEKIRIERLLKRNKDLSVEDIKERIANQIIDNERIKYSDYVIYNNDTLLVPQILILISKLG